jgi:hypothetical protein
MKAIDFSYGTSTHVIVKRIFSNDKVVTFSVRVMFLEKQVNTVSKTTAKFL